MTEGMVQRGCKRRVLSLPCVLWAAGGGEQPQVVQLSQDPFPEGQEAVTHSTTHQLQPTVLQVSSTHQVRHYYYLSCGHSSTNYPPVLIFQAGHPKEPNCYDQY